MHCGFHCQFVCQALLLFCLFIDGIGVRVRVCIGLIDACVFRLFCCGSLRGGEWVCYRGTRVACTEPTAATKETLAEPGRREGIVAGREGVDLPPCLFFGLFRFCLFELQLLALFACLLLCPLLFEACCPASIVLEVSNDAKAVRKNK